MSKGPQKTSFWWKMPSYFICNFYIICYVYVDILMWMLFFIFYFLMCLRNCFIIEDVTFWGFPTKQDRFLFLYFVVGVERFHKYITYQAFDFHEWFPQLINEQLLVSLGIFTTDITNKKKKFSTSVISILKWWKKGKKKWHFKQHWAMVQFFCLKCLPSTTA